MLRYVFLGLVQGLTEFLPVSSSAHLLFLRDWLGLKEPGPLLVAFLHLGTLIALLVWFWRDLVWFLSAFTPRGKEARRYLWRLGLALVPLIVSAVVFGAEVERAFSADRLASVFLLLTAVLLFGAERKREGTRSMPTATQALVIGLAQAVAVLPGLSRSGATVATGLFLGLRRAEAFRFSFLLGIPAFIGAAIFAVRGNAHPESWAGLTLGAFSAFLFGLLGLGLFRRAVLRGRLWPFALYCLALGLAGLICG